LVTSNRHEDTKELKKAIHRGDAESPEEVTEKNIKGLDDGLHG
jgi:hypothetical protein